MGGPITYNIIKRILIRETGIWRVSQKKRCDDGRRGEKRVEGALLLEAGGRSYEPRTKTGL